MRVRVTRVTVDATKRCSMAAKGGEGVRVAAGVWDSRWMPGRNAKIGPWPERREFRAGTAGRFPRLRLREEVG